MARKAATRPAKPKPATAAKPQDTEGAEDSLKGAQAPDQAEAQQQPSDSKQDGTAGGSEPPATNTPAADPAPAAEESLAAVMSAVDAPPPPVTTEVVVTPPAPDAPPSASQTEPQGVLVVTGPKRGRWRAGWHFGAEPQRIPLAGLTEDERAAIEGDPKLTVAVETEA